MRQILLIQSLVVLAICIPSLAHYNSSSYERIINGWATSSKKFPYHVAIVIWIRGWLWGSWEYQCGGTIINDQWILTAGHCFFYSSRTVPIISENIKVAVGQDWAHFFWQWFKDYFVKVVHVIPHAKFDHRTSVNDIGLLKLGKKLSFSETVKPVKLHDKSNENLVGSVHWICGFGLTQDDGSYSYQLLGGKLQIRRPFDCERIFPVDKFSKKMDLCYSLLNNADVCSGDSGGGLVRWLGDQPNRTDILIGVHSGSKRPCSALRPNIATKVSMYIDWIDIKIYSHR